MVAHVDRTRSRQDHWVHQPNRDGIGSGEQMDSKEEATRVDVEELTERIYAKE